MYDQDTIAAIATPPGEGGIGVIRISGAQAIEIAAKVFVPKNGQLQQTPGYAARFGSVVNSAGTALDQAVALVFRAPKSYTAEDVVELQTHGGPTVLELALRLLTDAGARAAEPGEFTKRAFLNGRISLTEAEAVASAITAASSQGQSAAAALMDGALYQKSQRIKDGILQVQSHIAAAIDFPEEDVEDVDQDRLIGQLRALLAETEALLASYGIGEAVLRGVPAVIVGSPNVGKSTIMNLLAGFERAIVSPTAGTTRDIVEHQIRLGGTTLVLADTAGIRAETSDDIEQTGIERAKQRIDRAALVLAVFDSSRPLSADDRALIQSLRGKKAVAVVNKTDLPTALAATEVERAFDAVVYISAKDSGAIAMLDDAVKRAIGTHDLSPDAPLLANERQRGCAARASAELKRALEAAQSGMTLDAITATLDEALAAVMELSGESVSEAVIDEVFSRFCVGK